MNAGNQSRAFERVIWIVLDSVGIGELPDAVQYGNLDGTRSVTLRVLGHYGSPISFA